MVPVCVRCWRVTDVVVFESDKKSFLWDLYQMNMWKKISYIWQMLGLYDIACV